YRLVSATMAEFEFESFAPKSLPENLVAEANAKDRNSGFDQVADGLDRVAERCRVAGAIGKEESCRFVFQRFGCGGCGRHHLDFEPVLTETAQDIVFHAI